MTDAFRIIPAGDASLIVQFDESSMQESGHAAIAAAAAISAARLPDVLDIVPTRHSVGVYFDPVHTDAGHLAPWLAELVRTVSPAVSLDSRLVSVPVCYGGLYGPDLGEVASFAGLSEEAVVTLHAGGVYRVGMLGFAPGFAYIETVDDRIAMPRRGEPRTRVPAGSVGIAGSQTGIYPFSSPGGWRLIGRTPIQPCDFSRAEPFLFAPGDRVRFEPIDAATFERLAHQTGAAASR